MVFIRHGGKHIKAHSCRVQLVKEKCLKGSNEPHTYTVEKRKVTINDIEGSNVPHTVKRESLLSMTLRERHMKMIVMT